LPGVIDSVLRLLALANQVASCGRSLNMDLADNAIGAAGHLNRTDHD